MIAVSDERSQRLAAQYQQDGDADFSAFIESFRGAMTADEIAELIDADGRLRISHGLPVNLSRYLDAVPDLAAMPVALDAAIEFTLRSLGGEGLPSGASVASLIADYPMFERAIRAASLLSEALWTTDQVRSDAGSDALLPVPSDFGPFLSTDQRRYELREILGSGAQGAVYLAVDRHLSDRTKPAWVAIKVMRHHVGDAIGRDRLIEEATRARRIDHPNVVRVLDRGVSDDGDDYIVYEYIEGPTLRGSVQTSSGGLDPRVAADLTARIARGVQAAHSVGVVHCDIKPDNILIPATGDPKVTDFGLAVRVDTETDISALRPSDGPMGNLGFISPEQYRIAEGAIAPPADIYACGGILYYLLTGLLPNGRSVEEVEQNLDANDGRKEPPRVRDARPSVDRDLEAICRRALSPRVADRYGSAEALANDLESWLRREPIHWTRPGVRRRMGLLCRREPLAIAILIALLATVGVASGLGVSISRESERRLMQEKVEAAAEIKRQTEEYHNRQVLFVDSLAHSVRAGQYGGLSADWLMVMMVFETILGPELTERAEQWAALRSERIEQLRAFANEPMKEGREKDLESMLWETLLGFFLIRDDRPEDGIVVLRGIRSELGAKLAADDTFLRMIDQMIACGIIARAVALPPEQRKQIAVLDEVRQAAELLEREEVLFRGRRKGDTLHKLARESLVQAYGQGLLDDAKRGAIARKKYIEAIGK